VKEGEEEVLTGPNNLFKWIKIETFRNFI